MVSSSVNRILSWPLQFVPAMVVVVTLLLLWMVLAPQVMGQTDTGQVTPSVPQQTAAATMDLSGVEALSSLTMQLRDEREQLVSQWNSWVGEVGNTSRPTPRLIAQGKAIAAAMDDLASKMYEAPRPAGVRYQHDQLSEGYFYVATGMRYLTLNAETGNSEYFIRGTESINEGALRVRQSEEDLMDILTLKRFSVQSGR